MADSPDLSPYLDLRIYDRDLVDIQDAAIQDMQQRMPGWVPREDATEMMLLEALALEVSESIFAINRLPGSVVQVLLQMFGVPRDEGTPPKATVQFRAVDSFGYTIPAGTRLMIDLPGDLGAVTFVTDVAVNVMNGSITTTVAVTGEQYTSRANNVPSGSTMEILDPINFIESAVLATAVTGGKSPETDQAWLTRGTQRFSRLVETLAVPRHFVSAALEKSYVSRAFGIDLYDPAVGGTPGNAPGHMTLAVYGNGQPLTTAQKNEMLADFVPRALANLQLHIVDPTITTVNVNVTVVKFQSANTEAVRQAIILALTDYMKPETWDWSGIVRRNELIALVSNVPGVDYVSTLTTPAADQTLGGVAALARLGTATVTVNV